MQGWVFGRLCHRGAERRAVLELHLTFVWSKKSAHKCFNMTLYWVAFKKKMSIIMLNEWAFIIVILLNGFRTEVCVCVWSLQRYAPSGYSPLSVDSWLWNSGNCVSTGTLMVRRRRWPLHDAERLSCKNKDRICRDRGEGGGWRENRGTGLGIQGGQKAEYKRIRIRRR